MSRSLPLLAALLMLSLTAPAMARGVAFVRKSDTELEIKIDGRTFGVLNHGGEWAKPFLFPVKTPSGKNVLRPIIPTAAEQGSSKEGTDHFHHKGVWIAVDSVNSGKLNYWHEKAKIVNNSVEHVTGKSDVGILTLKNTWMDGDSDLLKEQTRVVFHPNSLVTYEITLTAVKDTTFFDTKEGFFAVRMAHSMREQDQTGTVVNADGLKTSGECWGKPSPWIDYYGKVDGKVVGITLMDNPANFRKSRYHVRGYGLFSISPFGPRTYSKGKEPEAPVTIKTGESLTLKYGLYIHDGDTDTAKVADMYQTYLKYAK